MVASMPIALIGNDRQGVAGIFPRNSRESVAEQQPCSECQGSRLGREKLRLNAILMKCNVTQF